MTVLSPGIDLARVRADTPGAANLIHFGNAGASLQPGVVVDAVAGHLLREAEIGGYEAEDEAQSRLEGVYDSVAALINADRSEIALVDSSTRAFDAALHALPLRAGDIILTTTTEYASNYIGYLRRRRETGLSVQIIPEAPSGEIDLQALETLLQNPRVRLVAMSHVPTQSGLVQPALEVGRLTRAAGCFYLLDATQSVGQMPIDVRSIGCDALATAGRKYLRGPRATGFLYVRRDLTPRLHPVMLDMRSATWTGLDQYELAPDARRFEIWEKNVAGLLGLGAAAEYARALGPAAIWERVRRIAGDLRHGLSEIPGVAVHDRGSVRCGIISLTVAGVPANAVKDSLMRHNPRINVTVSEARFTVIDFPNRGLTETVRASLHYYNSEAEMEEFLSAIHRLAREAA